MQILINKLYYILLITALLCTACEFKLRPNDDGGDAETMKVERYDRLQSRYLITGDFSALQQMNTEYPIETKTLIENLLQIGEVSDHDINEKFLRFYQDSTLQTLINDAESEYANMDDINADLEKSFGNLKKWIPEMPLPHVYTQIGALDQSIVVGDKMIGVSLDKYMGAKYPLYKKYGYPHEQLETMGRDNIVPDCITFYLLSLYPMRNYNSRSQLEKDLHMGKAMWVANKAMGRHFFDSDYVNMIGRYMRRHSDITVGQLLQSDNYSVFK